MRQMGNIMNSFESWETERWQWEAGKGISISGVGNEGKVGVGGIQNERERER